MADCIEWPKARTRDGYGQRYHRGKVAYAHRIAWEEANGPIPDGLWVLHRCDNPPCVNPAHLFLGTAADNNRDMREKGRGGTPPRRAGSSNPAAKLTEAEVAAIRSDPRGAKAVAETFGLHFSTVYRIRTGVTWRAAA